MMAKNRNCAPDALAKDIRRQIKTQANARFLRRMPLFSVDHATPSDMWQLLDEMDKAEEDQRRTSRS